MEQRLKASFARALEGQVFPQFDGVWDARIDRAKRLSPSGGPDWAERERIALVASEPAWFWACFFVFGLKEWDVFLFNPRWGDKERKEALEIAQPHWIVNDNRIEKISDSGSVSEESGTGIEGFRVMIPTGGSSGKLRFAIHDWATLSAAVEGLKQHFGSPAISSLCMLPLYHVSGFMQTIRAVLAGGKVVFGTRLDFDENCRTLFSKAPEDRFLSLVPAQLRELLEDDSAAGCLSDFRAVFCGGGPLPEDLAKASREAGVPLAPTYGMTETAAQVATLLPEAFLDGIEGQGNPLPHTSIEITNTDAKSENVGDVLIQGPSLFRGYFGEAARREPLFATGDRGKKDEAGRIFILGRAGRSIISGGENIDLPEIEDAIRATGLVEDVVAFGIDDRKWGSRLCVAYVPVGGRNLDADLKLAIGKRLAPYKQPKSWLDLDRLPRNVLGKIELASLRRRIID